MRVSLRTTGHGSPAHRILAGSKAVVPMLREIGWRGFYRNGLFAWIQFFSIHCPREHDRS